MGVRGLPAFLALADRADAPSAPPQPERASVGAVSARGQVYGCSALRPPRLEQGRGVISLIFVVT